MPHSSPGVGRSCKGKVKPCSCILQMPFWCGYSLQHIMAYFSHKSLVKAGLPGFAL